MAFDASFASERTPAVKAERIPISAQRLSRVSMSIISFAAGAAALILVEPLASTDACGCVNIVESKSEEGARPVGFIALEDVGQLDDLVAASQRAPVIIFKHSVTCPISAGAYREMERLEEEDVAMVVVQRARSVARAIEERTGVRHESPQVIILRDGRAVWSASHWNVTAERVRTALRELKGAANGRRSTD